MTKWNLMHAFWKLTWTEIKVFVREPIAAFFTLACPLMFLFLFGSIYGNRPSSYFGGFGSVDISVPGYIAIIIANTGLISLAVTIANYRETGVLRRMRASPVGSLTVLGSQLAVAYAMTSLGVALLIIAARAVYGLRFAGSPIGVFCAFSISAFAIFSMGFLLAGAAPTGRAAQVAGFVLFFPMIFLSGATIPREVLPEATRHYAQILPLTHVVSLLRGMWAGDPWDAHYKESLLLAGLLIVCTLISSKTFRWES